MPKPMLDASTVKADPEVIYEKFRPKNAVDDIALVEQQPGWVIKGVATNDRHLGYERNVRNHEKAGYEVMYEKKQAKDDRLFTPDNTKREATVMAPVLKTCADGTQYLYMRIREDSFKKLMKEKETEYNKNYTKSVRSATNKGGVLKADGGEINFNLRSGETNE